MTTNQKLADRIASRKLWLSDDQGRPDAMSSEDVAIILAALRSSPASVPNDPHRFAVVSSDFCRPYLLGAYETLEAAQKAQCDHPERWPIYERVCLSRESGNVSPKGGNEAGVVASLTGEEELAAHLDRVADHLQYRSQFEMVLDPELVRESAIYIRATGGDLGRVQHALERAQSVLANMAAENEGAIFRRWPIHHEPLRGDARNVLPFIEEALTLLARDDSTEAPVGGKPTSWRPIGPDTPEGRWLITYRVGEAEPSFALLSRDAGEDVWTAPSGHDTVANGGSYAAPTHYLDIDLPAGLPIGLPKLPK